LALPLAAASEAAVARRALRAATAGRGPAELQFLEEQGCPAALSAPWAPLLRAAAAPMPPDDLLEAALRAALPPGLPRGLGYAAHADYVQRVCFSGGDCAELPPLTGLPDVPILEFDDMRRLAALPPLPLRVGMLVVRRNPELRGFAPSRAGQRVRRLIVSDNAGLESLPAHLLANVQSLLVSRNSALRSLPLGRQRRRGHLTRGPRPDAHDLVVCDCPALEELPPGFGAGWRVRLCHLCNNPNLRALPPFCLAGARADDVAVSHNAGLRVVADGFLHRARLRALVLRGNPTLVGLGGGSPAAVTHGATFELLSGLRALPRDLLQACCLARECVVRCNRELRQVAAEGPLRVAGRLAVCANGALTEVCGGELACAPGAAVHVAANPRMSCVAGRISGLPDLTVARCPRLERLETDASLPLCCVRLRLVDNSGLREWPRNLALHGGRGAASMVRNNPALEEVVLRGGPAFVSQNAGLRTVRVALARGRGGALHVQDNPRLLLVCFEGPGPAGGKRARPAPAPPRGVPYDVVLRDNPRLQAVEGGGGGGCGSLVLDANPSLERVDPGVLRMPAHSLRVARSGELRELPAGWAEGGVVLAGRLEVADNPRLRRLVPGGGLRVDAGGGVKVRDNPLLEELAAGPVRLRSTAGNVRVARNPGLRWFSRGGEVALSAPVGSVTVSHNTQLRRLGTDDVELAAGTDVWVEYHPSMPTLSSEGQVQVAAGRRVVLQHNSPYCRQLDVGEGQAAAGMRLR
jgi:hypothetical protein